MKKVLIVIGVLAFGLVGWQVFSLSQNNNGRPPAPPPPPTETAARQIAPEDAKTIIDSGQPFVLLDVRTAAEFAEAHIPGAKLLPDTEIQARAAAELPDKNALILVYCRSGARSAKAAKALIGLGYTDVRDLGGLQNWPFETATGAE
jgi:rhodanese-related sulfurtransferase